MGNKSTSTELFNKYFSLNNRFIEITLKDKTILKGEILGYFRVDLDDEESDIYKWIFAEKGQDVNFLGTDAFGFQIGRCILHKEIRRVRFMEDDTILEF